MSKADQEFDTLEAELKAMVPPPPSTDLKQRIADEMAIEPTRGSGPRSKRWEWGLAAAVLLGVGTFAVLDQKDSPPMERVDQQVDEPTLVAPMVVSTQRFVVDRADEGVFHMDGVGPVRKMRYQLLTRSKWNDAETGEPVSITAPNEQVVFVRLNNVL